jgi:hypothetical protein
MTTTDARCWPFAGLGGRPFSTWIGPERQPNPDLALCASGKPAPCALSRISSVEGEKRRRWLGAKLKKVTMATYEAYLIDSACGSLVAHLEGLC